MKKSTWKFWIVFLTSDNVVCKLQKSLYGLKQASRQWFAKLVIVLHHQGFSQSEHDASLFIKHSSSLVAFATVYVDDIILTGDDFVSIKALKDHQHVTFSIKDLGKPHYFLGIEVGYLSFGIVLTRSKFSSDLLTASGLTDFKTVVTPLPLNLKLSSTGRLYSDPIHTAL